MRPIVVSVCVLMLPLQADTIIADPPNGREHAVALQKIAALGLADGSVPWRERPTCDAQWREVSRFNTMLRNLCEPSQPGFGSTLKGRLLAEAHRRDLTQTLREAKYAVWHDLPD